MSASELDIFWNEEDLLLEGGGMLNPDLVRAQRLTKHDIEEIKRLHAKKDQIMRDAHAAVKQVEFEMQDAWGFGRDETRHTHRFEIPCPEKRPIESD